jgi:hypothetical protein
MFGTLGPDVRILFANELARAFWHWPAPDSEDTELGVFMEPG